ncbi:hypothetical protein HK100_001320 [Physocladia obscura]|uniref:Uncharacterized protein n=1 Tax=Physocladia obscura TaxID=109957 RepID=A0AAD5SWZ2_9FUNG|nr:hypothetical protein HK100_001320 [Physocladia obscura]
MPSVANNAISSPAANAARQMTRQHGATLRIFAFCMILAIILVGGYTLIVRTSKSSSSSSGSSSSTSSSSNQTSSSSSHSCYNTDSGLIVVLFANKSEIVNQFSSQCLALANLAQNFGFIDANNSTSNSSSGLNCVQNTRITLNSSDSFIAAQFCDANTIYSITVSNPPVALQLVPDSMFAMTNLTSLDLHGAFFGTGVLDSLLKFVATISYFSVLNVTGSTDTTAPHRVLFGSLPELESQLTSSTTLFKQLWLSNNNLSGPLPATYASSLKYLELSNNPNLDGPLPETFTQWANTLNCGFSNTSLCVPTDWPYNPPCIHNISTALPYCNSSLLFAPIDPTSPVSTSSNSSGLSETQIIEYAVIGVFGLMLFLAAIIFAQWRMKLARRRSVAPTIPSRHFYTNRDVERETEIVRTQLGDAGGDDLDVAMVLFRENRTDGEDGPVRRVREILDLPEYTPELPDYHNDDAADSGNGIEEGKEWVTNDNILKS